MVLPRSPASTSHASCFAFVDDDHVVTHRRNGDMKVSVLIAFQRQAAPTGSAAIQCQLSRNPARNVVRLPICRPKRRTQRLWETRPRLSVGFRPLPQTTPVCEHDRRCWQAATITSGTPTANAAKTGSGRSAHHCHSRPPPDNVPGPCHQPCYPARPMS